MRNLAPIMLLCAATAIGAGCGKAAEPGPGQLSPSPDREAQSVIRSTASPFCPGKTLDSCPSPKASEWRRDVHAWAKDGVPATEIRSRLQARTPGFDLSIRPARWSGWIPVAALLFSTFVMWLVARRLLRKQRRTTAPRPGGAEHRDELDRRLDEEISRLAEIS